MPSSPSTPVKKSSNAGNNITPSKPRKSPTCTKCKQPRLGHQRKGCSNVDSKSLEDDLVRATRGLKITPPSINDDHNERSLRRALLAAKLMSQPTLRSLSSTSSIIVNKLLEPGIMDDQSGEEDEPKDKDMIPWKENNRVLIKQGDCDVAPIPEEGQPQPLVRSMSEDQREIFIAGLCHSKASLAFAVVIPKQDLPAVVKDAEDHGFFTDANSDGLLIVGRNRAEVNKLRKKADGGGTGTFVKGMLTGSALTFTGLAYS